jgi:hypothetical protein
MSNYYENERDRYLGDRRPVKIEIDTDNSGSLAALGIVLAMLLALGGLLYAFSSHVPQTTTTTNNIPTQTTAPVRPAPAIPAAPAPAR